ncbi:MAG: GNAT family N-acetyltransferase [Sporichthyaceae bacterium]|nr:GNAT family N-acetyltransferase [Sporichthyaceae bacterium]
MSDPTQPADPDGFVIRAGRAADGPALVEVFHRSRAAAMPWLPVLHSAEEDSRWMADNVLGRHQVWVADTAGGPVGFCAVLGDLLGHIYVHPNWQGRGVGSALLKAARAGHDRLELWVFQRNERARAFYLRHGFVLAELTDGSRNEERTPDARYAWVAD